MKVSIAVTEATLLRRYTQWLIPLFEEAGHTVEPLAPQGSLIDLGDMLFSINFLPMLAQIAKKHRIPYCCWIIDPLVNTALLNPEYASEYTVLFHFSKRDLDRFAAAGYSRCHYLPLSILPQAQAETVQRTYNISFVGNCYKADQTEYYRYRQACTAAHIPTTLGLDTLDAFIELAASNWTLALHPLFTVFIHQKHPGFSQQVPVHDPAVRDYPSSQFASYFVDMLLYHEIDRRMRTSICAELAELGLHLWGDDGWNALQQSEAVYHGRADEQQISGILQSSRICLNMQRRITDGLNMRNFEVTAAGGLLLTQDSEELQECFEPGKECLVYSSSEEAAELAAYYLKKDSAADRIRSAGKNRFDQDHRLKHRFEQMRNVLKKAGLDA